MSEFVSEVAAQILSDLDMDAALTRLGLRRCWYKCARCKARCKCWAKPEELPESIRAGLRYCPDCWQLVGPRRVGRDWLGRGCQRSRGAPPDDGKPVG